MHHDPMVAARALPGPRSRSRTTARRRVGQLNEGRLSRCPGAAGISFKITNWCIV
jgi:hypothetical protein